MGGGVLCVVVMPGRLLKLDNKTPQKENCRPSWQEWNRPRSVLLPSTRLPRRAVRAMTHRNPRRDVGVGLRFILPGNLPRSVPGLVP